MNSLSFSTVSIVMGSRSDWPTIKEACTVLEALNIPFEAGVVSAHRTPERLVEFATKAKAEGVQVIIAGVGGSAHLTGMIAAMTTVPVVAVPVKSQFSDGLDSLLSIVQMPRGVAVATQAVGAAGAFNAGLMAAQILALKDEASSVHVKKAKSIIGKLLDDLSYVGTLCIEFFVTEKGLVINELAPRVHNSGHWTLDGCNVSQFENHMRAVTGMPLVEPEISEPTTMVNLLGVNKTPDFTKDSYHTVCLYGKSLKYQRKMGHVNINHSCSAKLVEYQNRLVEYLYG
ncbi:MAG: 5-(carboxyamino)imidazole ribonucleotide mutase [Flavobacteriales bacterium]